MSLQGHLLYLREVARVKIRKSLAGHTRIVKLTVRHDGVPSTHAVYDITRKCIVLDRPDESRRGPLELTNGSQTIERAAVWRGISDDPRGCEKYNIPSFKPGQKSCQAFRDELLNDHHRFRNIEETLPVSTSLTSRSALGPERLSSFLTPRRGRVNCPAFVEDGSSRGGSWGGVWELRR